MYWKTEHVAFFNVECIAVQSWYVLSIPKFRPFLPPHVFSRWCNETCGSLWKMLRGQNNNASLIHIKVKLVCTKLSWWRHQMKHFPRYWPFVRGIHRSPADFPCKGQWRGTLMYSLICAWTNSWANNRDAGDFKRHRVHCDVIVMECLVMWSFQITYSTWYASHRQ